MTLLMKQLMSSSQEFMNILAYMLMGFCTHDEIEDLVVGCSGKSDARWVRDRKLGTLCCSF